MTAALVSARGPMGTANMSDVRVPVAWALLSIIGAVMAVVMAGAVLGALVWLASVALVAVQ